MRVNSAWWIVSDLHLDADAPETGTTGRAFEAFLDQVVRRRWEVDRHLVLLGDCFEVNADPRSDDREARALRRLDRIGERFPSVFRELRGLLTEGVTVHVVCGNHDVDLARPAVRRELTRMLGGPDRPIFVHPWLLHVPGLLYAEHGSQHHDLGRMPTLLRATLPGPAGELPPPPLAAITYDGHRWKGKAGKGSRLARAVVRTARAEHEATSPAYQVLLAHTARTQRLPASTVDALARLSRVRPIVTAVRVGGRLVARRFGSRPDAYLRRAVLRIDEVMTRDGVRPACYAFGHTHVPAREPLEIAGAYYANCGTWSRWTREPPDEAATGFPYVLLEQAVSGVRVQLKRWRPPVDRT